MPEPVPYPFNSPTGLDLAPAYERAQCTGGLPWVRLPFGEPAWLVTRHADARFVLGDARFGRAASLERDSPRVTPQKPLGIVAMDPPGHTRLRRLVTGAFTRARVERLRSRIRSAVDHAVDDLTAAGAPSDLVEHVALPVPITVICELLGVPAGDRDRFRRWSEAVLSTSGLTPEEAAQSTGELTRYMAGLAESRRAEPGDDLISALVRAEDQGESLSPRELVELCIAILVGGYETTASEIANFAWVLLTEHPDQLDRVRAEPDHAAPLVEELLRGVPMAAAAAMPRYATEDVEVGGQLVRAGEPVLVAIGAANRDPGRYPGPARIDPARDSAGHLAFGHGIHHCLGAPLARAELQETVRVLARRLPGLRLDGPVRWKSAMFFRGPAALPVAW
ncbi:cytochrome P450 [Amycolatopsis endophytica]|uniref:Cytochrome P450 n=1 Tax=Amycolatopsis endophytica TaxID=860233 RepID=A0A853BD61_9PSEU|nr:cytochrome P450 [Amycolatopsis endophytica]NYI93358.1 cytochrome P450 [Amycolatopsis endophytica]